MKLRVLWMVCGFDWEVLQEAWWLWRISGCWLVVDEEKREKEGWICRRRWKREKEEKAPNLMIVFFCSKLQ